MAALTVCAFTKLTLICTEEAVRLQAQRVHYPQLSWFIFCQCLPYINLHNRSPFNQDWLSSPIRPLYAITRPQLQAISVFPSDNHRRIIHEGPSHVASNPT
jgi:hypothetical protein